MFSLPSAQYEDFREKHKSLTYGGFLDNIFAKLSFVSIFGGNKLEF